MRGLILLLWFSIIVGTIAAEEEVYTGDISLHKHNRTIFPGKDSWNSFFKMKNLQKGLYLRKRAEYFKAKDSVVIGMNIILLSNKEFEADNNKTELANNYIFIGDLFEQSNLLEQAERNYIRGIDNYSSNDSLNMVNAHMSVARVKDKMGDHMAAYDSFENAQSFFSSKLASNKQAEILNFKAILYKRLGRYKEALNIIDSAIGINNSINDTIALAINYTTKGNIYFAQNDYQNAYKFYNRGYIIEKDLNNGKIPVVKALNLAASLYKRNYDPYRALQIYKQIEEQGLDHSNSRVMAVYYYNQYLLLDRYFQGLDNKSCLDSALYYNKKARRFYSIHSIYYSLAKNAYVNNNAEQVFINMQKSGIYRDSLLLYETENSLKKNRLEKELRELEFSLNKKNEKIISENIRLKEEKKLQLYIAILVIIVLVLIIWLFVALAKIKRKSLLLNKKELERTNYKLNLSKEKIDMAYNFSEQLQHTCSNFMFKINEAKELNNNYKKILNKSSDIDSNKLKRFSANLDKLFDEVLSVKDDFQEDFVEIKARIKVHFPDLNKNDELLCFLLKLNHPVKEIANRMGISPRSVEVAKYRLRKKVGFESMEKFMGYLKDI